jgi:hypothetical protein
VSDSSIALDELLDLKILPAWVNEPAPSEREAAVADEERANAPPSLNVRRRKQRRRGPKAFASRQPTVERSTFKSDKNQFGRRRSQRPRMPLPSGAEVSAAHEVRDKTLKELASRVCVRFLPHPPARDSVVSQIKENALAYSIFALARLFLVKPERYNVRLTTIPESPLFQLGDDGAVSLDRESLERNAFRLTQPRFYRVEVTESEPIKGNFSNVARCKLTGTLLGPTNHHEYQRRLRSLFEQRFSRRMNFTDYQRQIEIVSDKALVEQWKEEARKVVTYSTLNAESPETFASPREAERHFRENYLPDLIRTAIDLTIDGPSSRRLSDRALHRLIEDEWSLAIRSPSHMLQELAAQFRQAGLHIFRHRRGMLFVSPIRVRPLIQDGVVVSPSIKAIMETLDAAPRITRKELAEKLMANVAPEDQERAKLALASDLHWLIREGHVIEFNDGCLDLPRVKQPKLVEEKPAINLETSPELRDETSGTQETGVDPAAETSTTTAEATTSVSDGAEVPIP